MNLSERERRALARIERHLRETDPKLAKLLSSGGSGLIMKLRMMPAPARMLVAGMLLMLVGCVTFMLPLAVAGAVAAVLGLLMALVSQPGVRFGLT